MASALNRVKSILHRRIKEVAIQSHSNVIKSQLTHENNENKLVRLVFCLKKPKHDSLDTSLSLERCLMFVMRIDEK